MRTFAKTAGREYCDRDHYLYKMKTFAENCVEIGDYALYNVKR